MVRWERIDLWKPFKQSSTDTSDTCIYSAGSMEGCRVDVTSSWVAGLEAQIQRSTLCLGLTLLSTPSLEAVTALRLGYDKCFATPRHRLAMISYHTTLDRMGYPKLRIS